MRAILDSLRSFDHLGFFAVWFAGVLVAAIAMVAVWTRLERRSSQTANPPRGE